MVAAVTPTPASGSITHLDTVVHVAVTGTASNDTSSWAAPTTALDFPTEPAIVYYLKFSKTGQDSLKSHLFSPGADGTAQWDGIIIPAAGTWTLDLCDSADDSVIATASVIVA